MSAFSQDHLHSGIERTRYKGRSFNSDTSASLYHMAVGNLWKLLLFHEVVVLDNGTKFGLNLFTLS